jgi:hypothetical protein
MHHTLANTRGISLNDSTEFNNPAHPHTPNVFPNQMHSVFPMPNNSKNKFYNCSSHGLNPTQNAASVWVVRYVDYTSKYGLGFLLNTGSVGVYFNDSTKIILSQCGEIFQYLERYKKDHVQNSSGHYRPTNGDHISQTHLITRYPMELHKKVTLLFHFRNYLTDNSKENYVNSNSNSNGSTIEMKAKIPVTDVTNPTGATSDVPFGSSSIQIQLEENNLICNPSSVKLLELDPTSVMKSTSKMNPISSYPYGPLFASPDNNVDHNDKSNEIQLPFLKKWVRTKHAILFRLSNKTVQVVFFDRR